MTYPRTESWRDDLDLEPNTHPTIAHALHFMRTSHAAKLANEATNKASGTPPPQRWPFPSELTPVDRRTPPPRHPDAEPAPW